MPDEMTKRGLPADGRPTWLACLDRTHRPRWRVVVRKANHSTFNGRKRTPSRYSEVKCLACCHTWRTKAAYVDELPDLAPGETRDADE